MIHEIIVQSMRGGTPAVAGRRGEVLCNPPRFIAEIAVETPNSCALAAARIVFHSENILTEPGQQRWINLRADILSPRIFGGCFKFLFEFGGPVRIEF